LGPGQRTEKQYLDDNGLEYEEVSMEQFHLIRRPDRRLSVMPIQHTENPMLAGSAPSKDHALSTMSSTNTDATQETVVL
jgi:hypothetical protein